MHITIYSQSGEAIGKAALPAGIFDVKVNEGLVHRAVVRQESNARHPIAHTKTRAERQGSTRKLYRQKGTGRARAGDNRTPNRKKGGVAMGPRNERNFTIDMSRAEQKLALFSTLTLRAREEKMIALDGYNGAVKTKAFATTLAALPVENKVLFVLPEKNATIERSSRNLPKVKTILVSTLNPRDVLHAGSIVFVADALSKIPMIWKPIEKKAEPAEKKEAVKKTVVKAKTPEKENPTSAS